MSDTDASQSPQDPTWDAFDKAEKEKAAQLEAAYQATEQNNSYLLNQLAGIEDMELTLVRGLSDAATDGPQRLNLPVTNASLYLRPDRREELQQQGEDDLVVNSKGNPFTIVGDIPPRTEKLIEDLIKHTEAVPNQTDSTQLEEIWSGNIAGQPIELVFYHQSRTVILPDNETTEPVLSLRAFRGRYRDASPANQ
jgi:hypothetical protein